MTELDLETPKPKATPKPKLPKLTRLVSKCGKGYMDLMDDSPLYAQVIGFGWKVKKGK